MRPIRRLALTALAAACVAGGSSAWAMSEYCSGYPHLPDIIPDCTTGPIPANRSGHFVRYSISPGVNYWVQDIQSQFFVAEGGAGWLGKRATVFGLWGHYTLRVRGWNAFGNINNT
jgi:hypothetical protein